MTMRDCLTQFLSQMAFLYMTDADKYQLDGNMCNMNIQITTLMSWISDFICLCMHLRENIQAPRDGLQRSLESGNPLSHFKVFLLLDICLYCNCLNPTGVVHAPLSIASVSVFSEVCLHLSLLQCCNVNDSRCKCACR